MNIGAAFSAQDFVTQANKPRFRLQKRINRGVRIWFLEDTHGGSYYLQDGAKTLAEVMTDLLRGDLEKPVNENHREV